MMLRKRSRPAQKDQSKSHLVPDPAMDPPSAFPSDGTVLQRTRSTSFFSVPGLFVGFSSKALSSSDSDASARSPTSPLDYKVFSNLGNPFVRSPRSPGLDSPRKSWDCNRVGLGLVDTLIDDATNTPGNKVLGISDSKSILFGSQMRIGIPGAKTGLDRASTDGPVLYSSSSPKPLPKNHPIASETVNGLPCLQLGFGSSQHVEEEEEEAIEFGIIHPCSLDISGGSSPPLDGLVYRNPPKSSSEVFTVESSKRYPIGSPSIVRDVTIGKFSGSLPVSLGAFHGFTGSLLASDIELSEDYTRIVTHGPNPKTTHIFGDCILEGHPSELPGFATKLRGEEGKASPWLVKFQEDPLPSPTAAGDFLSFCYSCNKKLGEGKDIYMYRGERAFCSCECRDQEISAEEGIEKPAVDSSGSPRTICDEEIFLAV